MFLMNKKTKSAIQVKVNDDDDEELLLLTRL